MKRCASNPWCNRTSSPASLPMTGRSLAVAGRMVTSAILLDLEQPAVSIFGQAVLDGSYLIVQTARDLTFSAVSHGDHAIARAELTDGGDDRRGARAEHFTQVA